MQNNNEQTTDLANVANCKFCSQSIAWLTAKSSGKRYPVDYDGEVSNGKAVVVRNKFHDCPMREKPRSKTS